MEYAEDNWLIVWYPDSRLGDFGVTLVSRDDKLILTVPATLRPHGGDLKPKLDYFRKQIQPD
jgi:hypothetical protein